MRRARRSWPGLLVVMLLPLGGACGDTTDSRGCGQGGLAAVSPPVELAFYCEAERRGPWTGPAIFVLDTARGRSVRLNTGPGLANDPTWSPDGRSLVLVSTRSGSPNLYRWDADSSSVRRITSGASQDLQPSWAPDGRQIVFSGRSRDGIRGPLGMSRTHGNLYEVSSDGGAVIQVTDTPGNNWDPAWSPDGSSIAFVSDRSGPGADLYLMDPHGGHLRRLTTGQVVCAHPSWSPDGRWLTYTVNPLSAPWSSTQVRIMVMDVSGAAAHVLVPMEGHSPAWSPDGTRIAFVSDRDGHPNLYVVRADGTGLIEVTHDASVKGWPTWRPSSAA